MALDTEAKYPIRRTYVVKVRNNAKRDALAGRLENVVTGRQRDFASSHELIDSIAGDLEASGDGRPLDEEGR